MTRIRELSERRATREVEAEKLLDERDRLIVDLREKDGLSYTQIAEVIGQARQNAHLAYNRGLRLLGRNGSGDDSADARAARGRAALDRSG